MLNQLKQLNLVYSAAAGLFLRGIFWVSARERPLSFWWRFTADHRTELHCQDAHDNHSFCLIAIVISFHSFYYRPRYSLANLLLKDTWWRLLNNKTEIICQSQLSQTSNFWTSLLPNNVAWYTVKVQCSLKQTCLFPAVCIKKRMKHLYFSRCILWFIFFI